MKHILKLIAIVLAVALGFATADARRIPGEKVGASVDRIIYDFGTVSETAPSVVHDFTVTNTGTSALAIIWVKPKCGCTAPEYPRKPLKPGESAKIKVTFLPSGQHGEVDKEIRVKFKNGAGTSEELSLRMTGVVLPDK